MQPVSVVDQVLAHLATLGIERVTKGMAELRAYCKGRVGAMTAVEAFRMVRELGGDAVLFREYRLAGWTTPRGNVEWWAVLAPGETP